MNITKIIEYIRANLDGRLQKPFVSKNYSLENKQNLYAGIQIALLNADKELTAVGIIDVFNAMAPKIRANMKFPTRRASVAFLTDSNRSEQGLFELFEWAETNQSGYGPRFELFDSENSTCFKTVKEMRSHFGYGSNTEMAKRLPSDLNSKKLRYIPPFDSINPFFDCKTLNREEYLELLEMRSTLAQYENFNAVQPKFEALIADFNQLKSPSLVEIAGFIKSMLLLHPFPDGNGRTFTLGILNQILLKNNFGICLNMNPNISQLSKQEIAKAIEANLVKLDQFELEKSIVIDDASPKIVTPVREEYQGSQVRSEAFFKKTLKQVDLKEDAKQQSTHPKPIKIETKKALQPKFTPPPTEIEKSKEFKPGKVELRYSGYAINEGKGRSHYYNEVSSEKNFQHDSALRKKYGIAKGDNLKSKILDDFKMQINGVRNHEEFLSLKGELLSKDNSETNVLRQAQGAFFSFFSCCGLQTTSMDALENMLTERAKDFPILNEISRL